MHTFHRVSVENTYCFDIYVVLKVDNHWMYTFNGLVIECVDSMAWPLNVHIPQLSHWMYTFNNLPIECIHSIAWPIECIHSMVIHIQYNIYIRIEWHLQCVCQAVYFSITFDRGMSDCDCSLTSRLWALNFHLWDLPQLVLTSDLSHTLLFLPYLAKG